MWGLYPSSQNCTLVLQASPLIWTDNQRALDIWVNTQIWKKNIKIQKKQNQCFNGRKLPKYKYSLSDNRKYCIHKEKTVLSKKNDHTNQHEKYIQPSRREKAKAMSQQIKKKKGTYKWPRSLAMRKMRIKTSSHWTLCNTISQSLN